MQDVEGMFRVSKWWPVAHLEHVAQKLFRLITFSSILSQHWDDNYQSRLNAYY